MGSGKRSCDRNDRGCGGSGLESGLIDSRNIAPPNDCKKLVEGVVLLFHSDILQSRGQPGFVSIWKEVWEGREVVHKAEEQRRDRMRWKKREKNAKTDEMMRGEESRVVRLQGGLGERSGCQLDNVAH